MFRCLQQHPAKLRLLEALRRVSTESAELRQLAGCVARHGLDAAVQAEAVAARGFTSLARPPLAPRVVQQPQSVTQAAAAALARPFSSSAPRRNPSTTGPVSYLSLAFMCATGGALVMYFKHIKEQRMEEMRMKSVVVAGAPAVGGPFELVDAGSGKRFTDADLKGRWALLYFGFTHCPDICPDELEKVAAAVDAVEKATGEFIVPVFISVDPERDTVPLVKEYVREFHPRMLGLTGTLEQTTAAAKAYRVYYSKTNDSPEDYLVDHSIITYLVNPEGDFVTFYGKNFEAPEMADSLKQHVHAWRKEHPK